MSLLDVDVALEQILQAITRLDRESVDLRAALGRVLAVDIQAAIDLPPFANSAMDGYAVRAEDVAHAEADAPVQLEVVMDIQAGVAPTETIGTGQAARIMTGAPVPDGADAIVPVEDTNADWSEGSPGWVAIYQPGSMGAHIRAAGENIKPGEVVLTAGTVIRPQELGVLAALGQAQVEVVCKPRVAVLSNGDELVGVEEPLSPGKIRDVNTYTIAGLLEDYGAEPIVLPVARDTLEDIRAMFQEALAQKPDMLISSAGVSVGAADYIRTVLEELGDVDFWRINLRPGKPLAYGQLQGVPFFGLPGNPVSVMVTFDVLVRPALLKMAGREDDWVMDTAVVQEDLRSDGRRSFLRVKLSYDNDQLVATTTGTQSSGALMSMVLADGLLIVPDGVRQVSAGTSLQVRVIRYPGK